MLRAGELRSRIQIDRAPKPWTPDEAGQEAPAWAEYSRPWADVQLASARELEAVGLTVSRETLTMKLRYSLATAEITTDEQWRVLYKTRYYDVRHADSRTRRHLGEAHLICEARSE